MKISVRRRGSKIKKHADRRKSWMLRKLPTLGGDRPSGRVARWTSISRTSVAPGQPLQARRGRHVVEAERDLVVAVGSDRRTDAFRAFGLRVLAVLHPMGETRSGDAVAFPRPRVEFVCASVVDEPIAAFIPRTGMPRPTTAASAFVSRTGRAPATRPQQPLLFMVPSGISVRQNRVPEVSAPPILALPRLESVKLAWLRSAPVRSAP